MPSVDIRADHLAIVQEILQQQVPEAEVWVFGSRAKWLARDTSDLDLCLRAEAPLSFERMGLLAEAFENSNLPYKVDIVDWAALSDSFRQIIERDKVVLSRTSVSSTWMTRQLSEMSINFDTQRKPVKESERVSGPYPYYGASGVVDYVDDYLFDGEYLLVAEDGENLRTRNTPIAFRVTGKFWVNNHAHVLQGNKNASTRFLNYALLAADITPYLTGAVMPKLTQGNLNKIELPCPPRKVQEEIVAMLGALDDRIENLRQTNATLEAIAAALFKSWFVDFDGVAPEDMQESELGLIPKGWRIGDIYEISDVRYGAPFASSKFNTECIGRPLVRIRDLRDEKPGVWTPEIHPKGYLIQPGDIVVGMDGEFRAHLWGGAPSWMNQRICAFHPKQPYSSVFVRNSIAPHLAHIEATEVATTVIHLGKGDIDRFKVVIPTDDVASTFTKLAQPYYDKIVTAKQQAKVLADLRDALLPRLISGQLRVSNAERIAEEAA